MTNGSTRRQAGLETQTVAMMPVNLSVESRWRRSRDQKERILRSGLSVEDIGSEKKQKDSESDASELKRLDARKWLQEDRDGARETQIDGSSEVSVQLLKYSVDELSKPKVNAGHFLREAKPYDHWCRKRSALAIVT
eukprot:g70728.t1